jgi:hypothetical protein
MPQQGSQGVCIPRKNHWSLCGHEGGQEPQGGSLLSSAADYPMCRFCLAVFTVHKLEPLLENDPPKMPQKGSATTHEHMQVIHVSLPWQQNSQDLDQQHGRERGRGREHQRDPAVLGRSCPWDWVWAAAQSLSKWASEITSPVCASVAFFISKHPNGTYADCED